MNLSDSAAGDFHLHTEYSDGLYTPPELVSAALKQRLDIIAVTDHDSMSGVPPMREAAKGTGLTVVAGVEFGTPTTDPVLDEIHIVGLFLDEGNEELRAALESHRAKRVERVHRIVEKLNRIGIALRPREVLELAGKGNVGRLHVARALVKAGHVRSVGGAFSRWLRGTGAAFVPRERPTAGETIALIHRAGGVAVMAHPGKTGRDNELPGLIQSGLDAIEVRCPDHSPSQERHYREMARREGLGVGGGSDCHGDKERQSIGRVRLEADEIKALWERAQRYRERG
jgi:hypothetical protein